MDESSSFRKAREGDRPLLARFATEDMITSSVSSSRICKFFARLYPFCSIIVSQLDSAVTSSHHTAAERRAGVAKVHLSIDSVRRVRVVSEGSAAALTLISQQF